MFRTIKSCLTALLPILALSASAASSEPKLEVAYDVLLLPDDDLARVEIDISETGPLRSLRLRIDPRRHINFRGTGTFEMDKGRMVWTPPTGGGKLGYDVRIDHDRDGPGKDAAMNEHWALFRGEDLFPPMATKTEEERETTATLSLRVPEGWSTLTPWKKLDDGRFVIEQSHRFFDRPTGWILAGKLGVTREKVHGIRIAIGNPSGHQLHRMDILALLRWTLDELLEVFPNAPKRFAIVGAADPMWRGGLSGPDSMYVHAERPMISSDGTSPILHELVHGFMHARAGENGDWIVEGLAEYYSLAALRRSKTFSKRRYERSLAKLAHKGRNVKTLLVPKADAAVSARAVVTLVELDKQIRQATAGTKSLDEVARRLASERKAVTTERFRSLVTEITGQDFDAFFAKYVNS